MRIQIFVTAGALVLSACVTTGEQGSPSPRVVEGPPSTLTTAEAPASGVAGSGTESYVLSAGTATYKVEDQDVLSTWTVELSPTKFVHSDGKERITKRKDAWGNTTNQTTATREGSKDEVFDPHNGFYPEQPLQVGMTWEHDYDYKVDGELRWRWHRSCSVPWRGEVAVAAGVFQDAWRLKCTSKRENYDLSYTSLLWLSSEGRLPLGYWYRRNHKGRVSVTSQELVLVSGEQLDALRAKR